MAERDDSLYIVTGGAGFIGANLVAELLRRRPGARVHVIDDLSTGSYANLVEALERAGVGPFTGSLTPVGVGEVDWDQALDALRPEAVFHLGAITDTLEFDERKMLAANSEPFTEMLGACAASRVPLVYASSAATYGSPPPGETREPFPVEAAGSPNNVYGFSKWLMDAETLRLFAERDHAGEDRPWVVGLRYFNVFGPGEARKGRMASMALHLTTQMLSGHRPKIFKMGEHARDQVPVEDVVDLTLAAAGLGEKAHPDPGIYNAGSGQTMTFNEIVAAINGALGTGLEPEYIDMPEAMVPTYQHYTCADLTATEAGLGWRPRLDPGEETGRYAAWIRDNAEVPGPIAR